MCVCVHTGIDLNNLADHQLEALCGLHRSTFIHIYRTYCGLNTVIRTQLHLVRIFAFMKHYPNDRSTHTYYGASYRSIKRGIVYLASVMNELAPVWNQR